MKTSLMGVVQIGAGKRISVAPCNNRARSGSQDRTPQTQWRVQAVDRLSIGSLTRSTGCGYFCTATCCLNARDKHYRIHRFRESAMTYPVFTLAIAHASCGSLRRGSATPHAINGSMLPHLEVVS